MLARHAPELVAGIDRNTHTETYLNPDGRSGKSALLGALIMLGRQLQNERQPAGSGLANKLGCAHAAWPSMMLAYDKRPCRLYRRRRDRH
jgi:hypothetical protein